MTINDLIVLRSIYVPELQEAVLQKDLQKVKEIAEVKCDMDISINNECCERSGRLTEMMYLKDIDIDIVHDGLQKALTEDLSWAY